MLVLTVQGVGIPGSMEVKPADSGVELHALDVKIAGQLILVEDIASGRVKHFDTATVRQLRSKSAIRAKFLQNNVLFFNLLNLYLWDLIRLLISLHLWNFNNSFLGCIASTFAHGNLANLTC